MTLQAIGKPAGSGTLVPVIPMLDRQLYIGDLGTVLIILIGAATSIFTGGYFYAHAVVYGGLTALIFGNVVLAARGKNSLEKIIMLVIALSPTIALFTYGYTKESILVIVGTLATSSIEKYRHFRTWQLGSLIFGGLLCLSIRYELVGIFLAVGAFAYGVAVLARTQSWLTIGLSCMGIAFVGCAVDATLLNFSVLTALVEQRQGFAEGGSALLFPAADPASYFRSIKFLASGAVTALLPTAYHRPVNVTWLSITSIVLAELLALTWLTFRTKNLLRIGIITGCIGVLLVLGLLVANEGTLLRYRSTFIILPALFLYTLREKSKDFTVQV